MKHIKSFTVFNKINEGDETYRYFSSLLGGTKDVDFKVGNPTVKGNVKFNITGDVGKNIQILIDTMKSHGITNPITQIAMLSVIGKESGFIPKNEIPYTNTPNGRIRKIFGKRVKGLSDEELDVLKKDETKFWDRVYGPDDPTGASQKMGNTNPGDGKKYTGRGFNGLTFKNLYQKYQKMLETKGKLKRSVNIVNNPEQLNEVDVAAEVAVLYFLEASKNPAMKNKYDVDDLNAFKDQKKAIKALAHANAGWGKDIDNSPVKPYEKAQEIAQKFKIDSSGTASLT
jgi:predicted chitinase